MSSTSGRSFATAGTGISIIFLFITKIVFDFTISREQMASRRRSCILVEGSPGYGKTTLARKIAADWGEKVGNFKLLRYRIDQKLFTRRII